MNERNTSLMQQSTNNHGNLPYPARQHSVQITEIRSPKGYQSTDDNYIHCYLTLKSQRTILERLLQEISDIDNQFPSISTPPHRPPIIIHEKDHLSIKVFRDFLNNFFNCSYGELLFISESASSRLKPIIRNQNLSFGVKKIANRMMHSVLAISHLLDSIENEYRQRSAIDSSYENEYSDTDGSYNEYNDNNNENTRQKGEICRMCNEYVPIELFEQHTQSCFKAYHVETKLQSIQNEMTYTSNMINEDYLCVPWPGEFDEVKKTILPMLRVSLLLERAIQIEWKNNEASDELQYISEVISFLNVEYLNQPCASIINTAKEQVLLKSQLSVIIKKAAKVLKFTRISGNDDTQKIAQVQISDFDFVKRISAGAFARVFLAKNKVSDDIYAIKVLSKDDVVQKNQVKRVVLEKDILLQFNNPYIINFYYSISGTRNLYLVMEYLPGGDLFSLLHNVGCLDERSAKAYTYQIAVALSYLHSRGIIHRDIKPDNVLIAADGSLKLTDFGLSFVGITDRNKKATAGSESHIRHSLSTEEELSKKTGISYSKPSSALHFNNSRTDSETDNENRSSLTPSTIDDKISQTRSIVGTPDYIAPEILENKEHTFCVDWWSLGAVLYELLVGSPPFHADTKEKVYENIKACRYTLPPIKKQTNDIDDDNNEEEDEFGGISISQDAADLIKGLLTLDPSQRLGANSSDDVIKHKWFSDIDPANIIPPFKPELETAYDTQYFENRYANFNSNDNDIIADIEDSLKPSNVYLGNSPNRARKRALTQNIFNQSSLLVPDDQNIALNSNINNYNVNYIINSCSYDNLGKLLHFDDLENNLNIQNNNERNDESNSLKNEDKRSNSNGNIPLISIKDRACSANLNSYTENDLVDNLSYLSELGKRAFKTSRKSIPHKSIGDFRSDPSPGDFLAIKRRILDNTNKYVSQNEEINQEKENNFDTNNNKTATPSSSSNSNNLRLASSSTSAIRLDNDNNNNNDAISNSSTASILSAGQSEMNLMGGIRLSNDYSESNDSEISHFPAVQVPYSSLENLFPSVSISQLKNKNMQVAKRHPMTRMTNATDSPIASSSFTSVETKQKEMVHLKRRPSSRLSNDDMYLPTKVPDLYERIKSSCSLSNENSYENFSDNPTCPPKRATSNINDPFQYRNNPLNNNNNNEIIISNESLSQEANQNQNHDDNQNQNDNQEKNHVDNQK